jgi:hypothetical protein
MIILNIKDGLGNQMFEYAFARLLQEKSEQENILINKYFIRKRRNREYLLDQFELNDKVSVANFFQETWHTLIFYLRLLKCFKLGVFNLKDQSTDKCWKNGLYFSLNTYKYREVVLSRRRNKYIYGNFENYLYVRDINDKLQNEFKPKYKFSRLFDSLKDKIISTNSVCLHVRRGDYLDKKWGILNICDKEYYMESISLMNSRIKNPVFFVFSNSSEDIQWIKKYYFSEYRDFEYIDSELSDFESFILMSMCKHFIISNSTFSWWAVVLSKEQDKIVIAPKIWCRSEKKDYEGLYLEHWIKI